jgi:hypothetical protein
MKTPEEIVTLVQKRIEDLTTRIDSLKNEKDEGAKETYRTGIAIRHELTLMLLVIQDLVLDPNGPTQKTPPQ